MTYQAYTEVALKAHKEYERCLNKSEELGTGMKAQLYYDMALVWKHVYDESTKQAKQVLYGKLSQP